MTTYELFSLEQVDKDSVEWKDIMVDLIDQLYIELLQYMSVQEADVCWNYLEEHYYYNQQYGEA